MTTYAYEALKLLIKFCDEEIKEEEMAPHWAYKRSAHDVLDRLHDCVIPAG